MNMQNGAHRLAEKIVDVAIVGGGLAGLIAAATIARAGRSVAVFEQSKLWGGGAGTLVRHGVQFNHGAHALYHQGHAWQILTDLGVPIAGRFPSPGSAKLLLGDTAFTMPLGLGTLMKTRFLSLAEKLRIARLLTELPKLNARALDHIPLSDWTAQRGGPGNLKLFLAALVRVATYVADHDKLSAGVAVDQIRLALTGNVLYLDGGWQRLVEGVRSTAQRHGAQLLSSAAVERVHSDAEGWLTTIELKDGSRIRCRAAILAVGPGPVEAMVELPPASPLKTWLAGRGAVRVACLDVALSKLPRPSVRFALGADEGYYFSVHSAAAQLAPAGVTVIHTMKYLRADERESGVPVEQQLETMLDRLQPGWRNYVRERRTLPLMSAAEAIPTAASGGLAGRPGVALAGRPSLFLAGDWVGPRGLLADAAAASAADAAQHALAHIKQFEDQHERNAIHASAR